MALIDALNQSVGKTYTAGCPKTFGGQEYAGCKINLAAITVAGTLTSVTDRRNFTDSARSEAADWFGAGTIQFTSGLNAGLKPLEIKVHAAGGVIEVLRSFTTPGFSAAVSSYFTGWSGGILFRSEDAGQTWTELQGYLPPGAVMGYANAIGAGRTDLCDKASVLVVSLVQGTLSSVTEAALFNGANLFAYGARGRWEIIGAQNCVLQADGTYWLTDLLRGRFGTEWACGLHSGGDTVVLLDPAHLTFLVMSLNSIGLSRSYRAVTLGDAFDSVSDDLFTYTGVNLECLSPVYFNGRKDPVSGDIVIEWLRRTRLGGEWRDAVDATLGETSEAYAIDIYSNGAYTTIKRSVSTTVPNFTYTSAMQTADFGASQNQLCVMIYQVSDKVGRGYPKKAWLPIQLDNPPWASTILAHMDDAGLTDVYGHAVNIQPAAARSVAQSRFGGYSCALISAVSYEYISYSGCPTTGPTGVFCVEAWVYPTAILSGSPYVFRCGTAGFNGWQLMIVNQKLQLNAYNGVADTVAMVENRWYHIAVIYQNQVFYLCKDGVLVGVLGAYYQNHTFTGITIGGGAALGYVDEFRYTIGNARYPSLSFTPPALPYIE